MYYFCNSIMIALNRLDVSGDLNMPKMTLRVHSESKSRSVNLPPDRNFIHESRGLPALKFAQNCKGASDRRPTKSWSINRGLKTCDTHT